MIIVIQAHFMIQLMYLFNEACDLKLLYILWKFIFKFVSRHLLDLLELFELKLHLDFFLGIIELLTMGLKATKIKLKPITREV